MGTVQTYTEPYRTNRTVVVVASNESPIILKTLRDSTNAAYKRAKNKKERGERTQLKNRPMCRETKRQSSSKSSLASSTLPPQLILLIFAFGGCWLAAVVGVSRCHGEFMLVMNSSHYSRGRSLIAAQRPLHICVFKSLPLGRCSCTEPVCALELVGTGCGEERC